MPNTDIFMSSRVALGIPIGGDSVHWRFMASLLEMQKTPQHGLVIRQGSLVDAARNEIVTMTLKHPSQFTHLLFLDSDMTFPQDLIPRLLAHDRPVVSALCFSRVTPYNACVFGRKEANGQSRWDRISMEGKSGLVDVDGCGTGCLLIRRDVLEKIGSPWFCIEWKDGIQRGEDIDFAEKCWRNKIPVVVDCSMSIGHLSGAVVEKDPNDAKARIRVLA